MADGLHRVLVLVGDDSEGRFLSPYLVPEWDSDPGGHGLVRRQGPDPV